MKKPNKKYLTDAEYVVAHGKWKKSRGRNPSLPFGKIKNPLKALAAAELELKSFQRFTERMRMNRRAVEWERSIGLIPRDPFAKKVPFTCYNYIK